MCARTHTHTHTHHTPHTHTTHTHTNKQTSNTHPPQLAITKCFHERKPATMTVCDLWLCEGKQVQALVDVCVWIQSSLRIELESGSCSKLLDSQKFSFCYWQWSAADLIRHCKRHASTCLMKWKSRWSEGHGLCRYYAYARAQYVMILDRCSPVDLGPRAFWSGHRRLFYSLPVGTMRRGHC